MERELRVSQRHPKPKLHTTALAEAVRAVQKQQPEATRFPIRQPKDTALGPPPSKLKLKIHKYRGQPLYDLSIASRRNKSEKHRINISGS